MSGARSVPPQIVSLAHSLSAVSLLEMFKSDPERVAVLSRKITLGDCELLVDFSKQRVSRETIDALVVYAQQCGVVARRAEMIAGSPINVTENRAVTHVALRAKSDITAPKNLRDQAQAARDEMHAVVAALPTSITHVINIGIGGSDLGPALLADTLAAMSTASRPVMREVRFVSSIDPIDLDRAVQGLQAPNTVFVVCSKSFGTSETLANARRAVAWLTAGGVRQVADHLIAVTARPDRISESGIPVGRILTMPESVGGRYSVSSSVVVAVAASFGVDVVAEVHDGMRMMDEHFVSVPLADNLPVLLGLIGWWNATILQTPTIAVVPYSQVLSLLPAYLQQLMMESNGKSVDRDGNALTSTSPIVWGGVGTNAQHAFFQLLHQGTQVVPCDFIGHSVTLGTSQSDHDTLIANMFAQAQVLAFGDEGGTAGNDVALRAHRATPGSRPSTTLLFSQLTPRAVGALIALYEHITFVQGVLWGVNSFDQWGVELGKQSATQVDKDMKGTASPSVESAYDASTAGLLAQHRSWRHTR